MKIRSAIVLGLVLLCGTMAFAQDNPKIEIPVGYSYMRFNPENSSYVHSFSLNGGGGGIVYYFSKSIGIEGEFEGYGSQTRTFTFAPSTAICPGTTTCTGNVQANLFTYNIGPIFKYRTPHFEPFVETLFGGAHSNVAGNLKTACTGCLVVQSNPSNNAFDFILGGGIDVPLTKNIAFRPAQFDFVLTRFGNSFTKGNTNQSNFRYQAGVVFRF